MELEFAVWLQRMLDERGLSQRAASLSAGLSPSTINLLLAHPDRTPDPRTCRQIAQLFGVDPDRVLALAGHRAAVPPPEQRTHPVEIQELADQVSVLPPRPRRHVVAAVQSILQALHTD